MNIPQAQITLEHLLRLSTIVKLFHFSTRQSHLHESSEDFYHKLETVTDDLIEMYQGQTGQILELSVGECVTIDKLPALIDIIKQSKKYVEENSENLDKHSINILLSYYSKFLYKIQLLS